MLSHTATERTPIYRTHPDHQAYHLYHLWPVTCILTVVAITFIVVAIYEPHLFYRRLAPPLDGIVINTGAWSLCVSATDSSGTISYNNCWDIDRSCQTPQPYPNILPDTFKGRVVNDCDRFNAARGAMVAAAILLGVGLLAQLLATCRMCIMSNAMLAFVFTMLGALAGMVAMALLATLHSNDQAIPLYHSDYDYGFWLTVAGWVVAFICSLFFVPLIASVPTSEEPLLPTGATSSVM